MLSSLSRILLALGFVASTGSALALTSPPRPIVDCKVTGAEKLPVDVGGAATVCAAMKNAAIRSTSYGMRVNVRVMSNSRLAATLSTSGGAILAERRFATSDRALTKSAIDRFARSLMTAAATAHHARTH